MMLQFDNWSSTETQPLWVQPEVVVAVREFKERRDYGGAQEGSELTLSCGAKLKVCGHQAKKIVEAQRFKETEA